LRVAHVGTDTLEAGTDTVGAYFNAGRSSFGVNI